MRLALRALLCALLVAAVLPTGAQAAGELFVLSQDDPAADVDGITGLVQLGDTGTETPRANTGGAVITGTGSGPIVYGSGVIKRFTGSGYATMATGVGSSITSMAVTQRGLVVANGDKLQYLSGGTLHDLPGGTIADGPWISISNQPNGLLLGWAHHGGVGRLYELNVMTGARTEQDFVKETSPFLNNCAPLTTCGGPPVPNSGGISVDGEGGIWVAGAGVQGAGFPQSASSQVWYAAPTTGSPSFQSEGSMFTRPHVATTADGTAYFTSTDNSDTPYFGDVYKYEGPDNDAQILSAAGELANSYLIALAVDRCYSFCTLTPPPPGPSDGTKPIDGGGGGNGGGGPGGVLEAQQVTTPSKNVNLGKGGLVLTVKCRYDCSVAATGTLVFGRPSAAVSNKLKKATAKLKAGKAKKLTLKLSKGQRKKVKRALRKKRKVTAKLKIVVKAPGVKTVTRRPKLRVR